MTAGAMGKQTGAKALEQGLWQGDGAKNSDNGVVPADGAANNTAVPQLVKLTTPNRWWHVAVHVMTLIIGTGVLGLPGAMKQLTWAPGMVLLAVSFVASYYTACLLGLMHQARGDDGPPRRLNTYFALGEHVLGKRRASWLIAPFQLLVLTGTCIAYLIAQSGTLSDMYAKYCADCRYVRQLVWTTCFAALQLVLCLMPSLESVTWLSTVAAVCGGCYCVMSIVLCFYVGRQPGVTYEAVGATAMENVFNILTGLSTMAFAFGSHMMLPEVQATLRSAPPPEREFIKGISAAWAVTFFLYFGSSVAGYWAFGSTVSANVLSSLALVEKGPVIDVVLTVAQSMVIVNVIVSYQVMSMPVYGTLERAALRCWPGLARKSVYMLRIPVRYAYVSVTYLVAISLPFFGSIMALFGAVGMTPLTFVVPSLLYLVYVGEAATWRTKVACGTIIVVGTLVGVAGTAASVRQIVLDADTFEMFL